MAPQAMKKPVVKKIGADTKLGDAKKRMKKSPETYKIYINKMLQQVHPDTRISWKAMEIMNSLMNDMFEKLVQEAASSVGEGQSTRS